MLPRLRRIKDVIEFIFSYFKLYHGKACLISIFASGKIVPAADKSPGYITFVVNGAIASVPVVKNIE